MADLVRRLDRERQVGVNWLPRVFFYSALTAGVIALGHLVLGHFDRNFLRRAWRDAKLAFLSLGQVLPESISGRTHNKSDSVPWGVAFGAGTILAYYLDRSGRWAGF